jgi:5-methyltetrahydrofolate--homocysteine methyltransferase
MSEAGPPSGVEDRVVTSSKLVDRLTAEGFSVDDLYVDACVMPTSTSQDQGAKLLAAVQQIVERYPGIHISAGVSNVSFGLPQRKLLNQVFLLLLMAHGLDTAIVDPCDHQLITNVLAAEALLGRDEYTAEYLRAYRQGRLTVAASVPA